MENFGSLFENFNILNSSIQGIQHPAFSLVYLYLKYICMLIFRSWPCPKCTFIFLYTALNLKACTINNASGATAVSKEVRDVSKGGGGGGVGGLQKNVHMTFLVDKIDMCASLDYQANVFCYLTAKT